MADTIATLTLIDLPRTQQWRNDPTALVAMMDHGGHLYRVIATAPRVRADLFSYDIGARMSVHGRFAGLWQDAETGLKGFDLFAEHVSPDGQDNRIFLTARTNTIPMLRGSRASIGAWRADGKETFNFNLRASVPWACNGILRRKCGEMIMACGTCMLKVRHGRIDGMHAHTIEVDISDIAPFSPGGFHAFPEALQ